MAKNSDNLLHDVAVELRNQFRPPYTLVINTSVSGAISLALFLGSLALGSINDKLLPFAATVILLWTLSDVFLTNQLVYDRERVIRRLEEGRNVEHLMRVKNITVAIMSIPLCIIFGLVMVAVLGKWSELINGLLLAIALIWGWLGVSNIVAVQLPFKLLPFSEVRHERRTFIRYTLLYCLPWLLLPIYDAILILPLILLHWITGATVSAHMALALVLVAIVSLTIWQIGVRYASRHVTEPTSKIRRLLSEMDG